MASSVEKTCSFPSKRCNILLLGETGSGKSTVANKILCDEHFRVKSTLQSVTGSVSCRERALEGPEGVIYSVKVVDTVGFSDLQRNATEILESIKEFFQEHVVEGVSLVLFVLKKGALTNKLFEMIEIIKKNIDGISPMSALVLTHCDGMDDEPREQLLRQYRASTSKNIADIAKFMQKGMHTVGFADRKTVQPKVMKLVEKDMEVEVKALHQLVYKSTEMHLTSEMFFSEEFWTKVKDADVIDTKPESGCNVM